MNPLPTEKLDLTILLWKSLQGRQFGGGQVSGSLVLGIDFVAMRTALDRAELLISSSDTERSLECHVAPGFFTSLDELLSSPGKRISVPPKFYLADRDVLYTGDAAGLPLEAQHYLAAAKLYGLLQKEADHQGGVGDAKTLIFLHHEKIEITPHYAVADLHELPELGAFEADFISSDTHREQKRTILKTVLLELFTGRKKLPFAELLGRFDEFVDKVRASYQLYVAEFSFQKVKAEVEKEKLDAMVKLNKVFSDVQGQLLAVPVALVLVGGQMKDEGAWNVKNLLIWFGALVFSILMDLLIRNQRHTLKAVKNEIDQQRDQIKNKYRSIADRFKDIYDEIDGRHNHQNRLIWVVDGLVAASLGITTFLLLRFSGAV